MKFNYYPSTDSLYIDLSDRTAAESEGIAPGVVVDFDEDGNVTGLDIDHASKVMDLAQVHFSALPLHNISFSPQPEQHTA